MELVGILESIKIIRRSKDQHFLSVDKSTWDKWFWIITPMIWTKKDYRFCIIYRKKYKFLKNIVVIGLKWNGKNVKRRTSGFAKDFLTRNRNVKCIYCETKLNPDNATADHIIPISEGGNNAQVNLMVCCFDCNNERGSIPFFTYLKMKNSKFKNTKRPFI